MGDIDNVLGKYGINEIFGLGKKEKEEKEKKEKEKKEKEKKEEEEKNRQEAKERLEKSRKEKEEKEEILNDLCEILDYQPKKEVRFEGTIHFSGRIDIPLAEYEDFDLDDYVNDITVDCYNGDVVIDECHTEEVREA